MIFDVHVTTRVIAHYTTANIKHYVIVKLSSVATKSFTIQSSLDATPTIHDLNITAYMPARLSSFFHYLKKNVNVLIKKLSETNFKVKLC